MGRFARVLRDGSRKNVSDQGGTRRERRQRHKVPARLGFIGDEIVDSISNYDFGQSRKEKYVGPGTGSITITPTRKGYSKTGGGSRMNIPEKATTKWVSGNVHGDTYETQHPSVKMRTTGEVVVPRHKEISRHPFVMRTQGGRNIPKDKWEREKYWGTYNEVSRTYR